MLQVVMLAALVAAASPVSSPSPTPKPLEQLHWRNIGPAVSGGRAAAVAGTDSDPALYYAGAAGGGVWKSTSGGAAWQPVFDAQPVSAIGAITIDPRNEQSVWVGTGEANPRNGVSWGDGVYHTSDGGKTWRHQGLEHTSQISRILVDPRDSNAILVGALGDPFADSQARGVYRSTDGGATWRNTLYAGPSSGVSEMARVPGSPDAIYAGVWQVRRTAWSLQSGGPNDGLYRSLDNGLTWKKLEGHGLPTDTLGRIAIAISPSNPRRIYVLIQSKQGLLWRSDDGGENWQMVQSNPDIDERPYYFSEIAVDPTDENHLFSASVHLTESVDGGKTFKEAANQIYVDHHEMWIAASGKRIIEANDGGVALSQNGGESWSWANVLPISQLYHVGYDNRNPYDVCAPLQDNSVWCAPNNGLTTGGISSSQWRDMGGGDGTWVIPDPVDSNYVWLSSAGGNFAGELDLMDLRTTQLRSISPYLRDQNVVDPKDLRYRFNWEAPLAFDPFDPHRAFYGGNVLFATHDRGEHWKVISADLTKNIKAHEVVGGGVTLDGTGAETTGTILYIEPSTIARGLIWVGTDDGYVQLTRDGGKHWSNVTPKSGLGRFASLSASKRYPGTTYAAYDAHFLGDRSPHLFVTHNYGTSWESIANGLPADQEVRSVREDPRNPQIIYAGLENSFWASLNGGKTWRSLNLDLPPTSVRDIQVHPVANDLIVATHGRGAWILDDITPLQMLRTAQRATSSNEHRDGFLFPVREAYLYQINNFWQTPVDGSAPAYGAIITLYLKKPAKQAPLLEILDSTGHVIRRSGTHDENGTEVPDLSNQAGMNRVTWDLTEQRPVDWNFAPEWNRGYSGGAQVLPGKYIAQFTVDGQVLRTPITVKADPRNTWTQAQLGERQSQLRELFGDFSRLDTMLNRLGAMKTPNAKALVLTMTSNPQNDQDNDFLKDRLREALQTQIGTFQAGFAPPTAAQRAETAVLHTQTNDRAAAYAAFFKSSSSRPSFTKRARMPLGVRWK